VQFGLRATGSCGVVARARAVARRNGGHGRWCLSTECIETLCRVGDEVVSMLVVSASVAQGWLLLSSLERPVFAPPIAFMASSL
jgi:hypothetical protein